MRIPMIITLFLLGSINLFAAEVEDEAMSELFHKYDQVMDYKRTELIEDVFTKKFLKESGGKDGFISKLNSLKVNKPQKTQFTWQKGVLGNMYLARPKVDKESPEFIIIKEDGKLKIDGTASDAD